jgi:predicted RNA-binding protein
MQCLEVTGEKSRLKALFGISKPKRIDGGITRIDLYVSK